MKFQQYNERDLVSYLQKFVCGMPIECHDIRHIDLYGIKKPPWELFKGLLRSEGKTGTDQLNYFFTPLKKKSVKGRNFNRTIAGVGQWKGRDISKEIYDKEGSVIGSKRTFRFDEESSRSDNNQRTVYWIMKEYSLDEIIVDKLRQRDEIQKEDYVVCSIMRKVSSRKNSQDVPSKAENEVSNHHHRDNVPSSSAETCRPWPYHDAAEIRSLPPLDGPFRSLNQEDLALFEKPDPGYPQAYQNKKLE
ncbi:NAC domain-containing protein 2-like [Capsicum chacoense]